MPFFFKSVTKFLVEVSLNVFCLFSIQNRQDKGSLTMRTHNKRPANGDLHTGYTGADSSQDRQDKGGWGHRTHKK